MAGSNQQPLGSQSDSLPTALGGCANLSFVFFFQSLNRDSNGTSNWFSRTCAWWTGKLVPLLISFMNISLVSRPVANWTQYFFMRTETEILIRLGGCPGWSESSLGPHDIVLVLSCGGSNLFLSRFFFILADGQTFTNLIYTVHNK